MRVKGLAAVAAILGLAGPALALDKVKFGTNWLADPEAGGFYEALVDGTYAKYGLDVKIIPGGPQSDGALMLLSGKMEFFMGGDQIGDFLSAQSELPLIAVAAEFQKSPQILMSIQASGWTSGRICRRPNRSTSEPARSTRSTTGCLSPTASRSRTSDHTISIPHPSSRTRRRSSRAMSRLSPTRSRSRASSGRTSSCSPTTATRP